MALAPMSALQPLPAFHGDAPHADAAQFDALVEAVGPESCLVVIARMMSAELLAWSSAEDLWQDALALAWRDRAQHRFEGVGAYRRWLLAIARNRARDLARQVGSEKRGAGRRAELFGEMRDARALSSFLPPDSRTPSRIAGCAERAQRMREALASLPEELEPVVRLHLFEERTMESIADELGLHLAAAWRRFRKGAALYGAALEALRTRATEPDRPA